MVRRSERRSDDVNAELVLSVSYLGPGDRGKPPAGRNVVTGLPTLRCHPLTLAKRILLRVFCDLSLIVCTCKTVPF